MEYKENKEGHASACANQAADVSSKQIFGNHTLCAQFLRDYSGLELFANVQPEDIEDVSERYHLFRESELNADTVKKVRIRNRKEGKPQDIYVISLIEHKSAVDYDVTMQILKYMVCIWENYVREVEEADDERTVQEGGKHGRRRGLNKRKYFLYPPIYPMVYYEGAGEWTAARNLRERVLLGELFQAYIPDITYKLVRAREYSNEELLLRDDAISLIMIINKVQKAEDFQKLTEAFGKKMMEILRKAPADVAGIILSAIQSLCTRINLPQNEADEIIKNVEGGSMGILFENMEKMDIQLERRRTEEQRQRAEEAEKRIEEAEKRTEEAEKKVEETEKKAEQEKQNLYRILISTYRKQGMTKEDAKKQLMAELSLEEKETDELLEKFWNE